MIIDPDSGWKELTVEKTMPISQLMQQIQTVTAYDVRSFLRNQIPSRSLEDKKTNLAKTDALLFNWYTPMTCPS